MEIGSVWQYRHALKSVLCPEGNTFIVLNVVQRYDVEFYIILWPSNSVTMNGKGVFSSSKRIA